MRFFLGFFLAVGISFLGSSLHLLPVLAQEERQGILQGNIRQAEASGLFNQGIQQIRDGQTEAARQSWQEALEIYRQINDRYSEAVSLNELGNIFRELGQHQQAIDYFQQALLVFRSAYNDYGRANVLNNLGNTYGFLGQYQQALDHFQQALLIYRGLGSRTGEAAILANLGAVYADLDQNQQAIDYLQRSVNVSEEVRADTQDPAEQQLYTQSVTPVYHVLAQLLQQQGRSAEAQAVLDLLR